MATIAMTEFDQNPSAATRLAREQDVTITSRGEPAFELKAVTSGLSHLDQLRRSGYLRPRKRATGQGWIPGERTYIDPEVGRAAVADFEESRARRNF